MDVMSKISAGILAVLLMFVMTGCALTRSPQLDTKTNEMKNEDTANKNVIQEEDTVEMNNAFVEQNVSGEEDELGNETELAFDLGEDIAEPRQLTAVPAVVSRETILGADGPSLDYAGNNVLIFHDYFGLIVYDIKDRKILRSLDLASIGCDMTQGDNACQIAVSADGTKIWLHPRKMRYMFRYEIEENQLYQLPLVKTFEIDLEAEDIFDRYLTTEVSSDRWQSNYLYEEYEDEKGIQQAYIYLFAFPQEELKLCSLNCVWDDMMFILWDEGIFPYQSDDTATQSIFDQLNQLAYQNYTCDGLPEYRLTSDDGITYYMNFSEKWVWRGKNEQAKLPDEIISQLEANKDIVDIKIELEQELLNRKERRILLVNKW